MPIITQTDIKTNANNGLGITSFYVKIHRS